MRAGLIISAIGHGLLSTLVLASSPNPLGATNTQSMLVDLVPASELHQAVTDTRQPETPRASTSPPQQAEALSKVEPGRGALIKAPEVSDPPRGGPKKSAPTQSARADGAQGPPIQSPKGQSPAASAPAPTEPGIGPSVELPAGPPGAAASNVPPMSAAADLSVLPMGARPPATPATPNNTNPLPPANPGTQAPPASGSPPAEAPKPSDHPENSAWYDVFSDMPVLVNGKPPEETTGRGREEAALIKKHLKKCWKPPPGMDGTGGNAIIRVFLQSNGALAQEPMLLVAPASESGPALVQAAISALQQCQPYAFLPAAKYKEWKTLDLRFSRAEMTGG